MAVPIHSVPSADGIFEIEQKERRYEVIERGLHRNPANEVVHPLWRTRLCGFGGRKEIWADITTELTAKGGHEAAHKEGHCMISKDQNTQNLR